MAVRPEVRFVPVGYVAVNTGIVAPPQSTAQAAARANVRLVASAPTEERRLAPPQVERRHITPRLMFVSAQV